MAEQADPRDAKLIPTKAIPAATTTNNKASDNTNAVQANTIAGGVHMHTTTTTTGPAEPDLVSSAPAPDELAAAREFFVARGGRFEEAKRRLAQDRAVLLGGNGTGWYIAALHLLDQHSPNGIKSLNPPRYLNEERAQDLKAGHGYVWHARQPFEEFQFEAVHNAVRNVGGHLVVLVHHPMGLPDALQAKLMPLEAPDPLEVAKACVRMAHSPAEDKDEDEDKQVWALVETFGPLLRRGTSPRKAAQAAELAVRLVAGELGEDEAIEQFNEELSGAVRRWFDTERWLTEYVAMVAVSVLENLSTDRVFAGAEELEKAIREAELPADKKPRPRRVFQFSRDELLDTIGATVERRDHPRHTGLYEETVRFDRHDWARALLCHAWVQYPALQPILAEWLVYTGSFSKGVPALCKVIIDVPASDPLFYVKEFGGGQSYGKRVFAAATLSQLATEFDRHELVAETLDRWIERPVGVWRKTTAAMVYGLSYGIRSPNDSLAQLERIGRTDSVQQQNAVVWAARELFRRPANQVTVLQAMCRWVYVADRSEGLRTIALSVGWQLVGIDPDPEFDFPPPAEADRLTVRRLMAALFWHVLRDEVFGARALKLMLEQALEAQFDPKAKDPLLALMEMVLDGGSRRLAMRRLHEHHPRYRRRIRRLFRLVRLLEARPWWMVVAGWAHGSRRAGQAAGS